MRSLTRLWSIVEIRCHDLEIIHDVCVNAL